MPNDHRTQRPQQHGARPQQRQEPEVPAPQFSHIKLAKPLDPELFNSVAKIHAKNVAKQEDGRDKKENKPTQLRRFYDELVSWESRLTQHISKLEGDEEVRKRLAYEKFQEFLPFIRMLNAKAAYAEGRKLVDRTFVNLMHHTLGEVKDAESLTACKLFWEAFMGFYKQERQD